MKYLSKRPQAVNGGLFDFPTTIDEMFQRYWNPPMPRADLAWHPVVDIVETPQAYVLKAELPGVAVESIDATVTGDTLVLKGEKLKEERLDGESMRVEERTYGRFERTFAFPTPVAANSIEAQCRHGILTITVKKAEEAQPRRIEIQAG